jgi:A/G-specific adenine glycosylase
VACQQLGLTVKKAETLAEFLHVFTHYRLTVRPHFVQVERDGTEHSGRNQRLASGEEWVPVKKLSERGLPAPVRKLLDGLIAAHLLA